VECYYLSLSLLVVIKHSIKILSGFLAQAGFTQENPGLLEQAIRELIAANEAVLDGQNEYGSFYRVVGDLHSPEGILATVTVWIQLTNDNRYRFVTLKPAR
jgi:hypothetical protein